MRHRLRTKSLRLGTAPYDATEDGARSAITVRPSAIPGGVEVLFLPGDVPGFLHVFRLQHHDCPPLTTRTTPRGYHCLRCRRCRAEVWERPHANEKGAE